MIFHNLNTARLTLRLFEEGDEEYLWPHVCDERITRYMAWSAHKDLAQTRAFVKAEIDRVKAGKGVSWLVFEGDAFCGIVSLIDLCTTHRDLTFNRAEFAYWLVPAAWGRGLMTEACREVMRFAFEDLGLNKLVVSHFGVNDASRTLIERLGFRKIGIEEREFKKDGVWFDHVMYELLAKAPDT